MQETRQRIGELAKLAAECNGKLVGKAVRDIVRDIKVTRMDFWFTNQEDANNFSAVTKLSKDGIQISNYLFSDLKIGQESIPTYVHVSDANPVQLGSSIDDLYMVDAKVNGLTVELKYMLKNGVIGYRPCDHSTVTSVTMIQNAGNNYLGTFSQGWTWEEKLTITNGDFSLPPVSSWSSDYAAGRSLLERSTLF